MRDLVTHDTSLAYEFPSRLELRFNQDDHLPAAALACRLWESGIYYRREHQSCRNECHVDDDEVYFLSNGVGGQVAGVGFFEESNTRVLAQFEIHLPITGIDSNYA